jgi:hypothetical protein
VRQSQFLAHVNIPREVLAVFSFLEGLQRTSQPTNRNTSMYPHTITTNYTNYTTINSAKS